MEMFQPNLRLSREPDGELTIDAVTFTPTSAYSAGRARAEVPPSVRTTPETLTVLLQLKVRKGPALMVLRPVRHRLRHQPIDGKTRVLAFAMVGDHIVGSASLAITHLIDTCPTQAIAVDTSDWNAWMSQMPPGPGSLHVTGTVHLPSPGYTATLEPAAPQGINPTDLLLDLVVTPRPGNWPEVITPTSVRFDQEPAALGYKSVLIREPDGDAVQLDVDTVF